MMQAKRNIISISKDKNCPHYFPGTVFCFHRKRSCESSSMVRILIRIIEEQSTQCDNHTTDYGRFAGNLTGD